MANSKKTNEDQFLDHDQNVNKASGYLQLDKKHKDWYEKNMGKQGGKPQMVAKEAKKAKGNTKHSLRKEK